MWASTSNLITCKNYWMYKKIWFKDHTILSIYIFYDLFSSKSITPCYDFQFISEIKQFDYIDYINKNYLSLILIINFIHSLKTVFFLYTFLLLYIIFAKYKFKIIITHCMVYFQLYFDWIKQNISLLNTEVSIGLFSSVITLLNYLSQANIEDNYLDLDYKQTILPEEIHLRGMRIFSEVKKYCGECNDSISTKNKVYIFQIVKFFKSWKILIYFFRKIKTKQFVNVISVL